MFAVGCLLGAAHGGDLDWKAPSAEAAIAGALGRRGLACSAADVAGVEGPGGVRRALFGRSRAIVRARPAADPSEPSDLYLIEARLSPDRTVLWIGDVWNLTNTSSVDESRPLLKGSLAAYTTSGEGLITGVHVLDLAGPPAEASDPSERFTRLQRVQAALTNYQQTGQMAGVAHTAFALDPVAGSAEVAWLADGMLEARVDDHLVLIDPRTYQVVRGGELVRVVADERARPGNLVTWAVDRVRALSWFGDDRMQWVKAVAFTALDKARALFSQGTTAEDVRDEIGLQVTANAPAPGFIDPEVGWPPLPLKPVFPKALRGEGQWIGLEGDAFITPTPDGVAPAFVTSFIRPDTQRADVRVYVTLWDPRQVGLHMEAGTVEPISATGEHGSGLIPRAPEVMDHVVAAFNGGFQAQHGEYGMQANGIEYVPPKPYAATVVELRDGANGFGTWPADAAVPEDVIGLRQNLTALVENGKFNPWGRTWWGGAPPGWPDQIHTARSAICMTREGFAGYFYSSSISAEDLAAAMLAARCSFGIHLDMNVGHAGFEFYDVAREGRLAPLARPLQSDWEAVGKVPDMPGYVFRARRMIRSMGHMLFPRYIQREARDFFYLTSRSILPGAPIPPADRPDQGTAQEPDEGRWRTRGLPQHGFPFAVATARARGPGDVVLRVIRADPRVLRPDSADLRERAGALTVLSFVAPSAPARAMRTLWWNEGLFTLGVAAPSKDGLALLGGCAPTAACAAGASAEVGVADEDGMLDWVELPPGAHPTEATAAAMDALLSRLGCSSRMAVPGRAQAWLGEGARIDASGEPVFVQAGGSLPAVRLVRAVAPDAHPVFADTPIVPIQVWQPLQAKRVRYFYRPSKTLAASRGP